MKQLTLQDLILQEEHKSVRRLILSGYTFTDYKSEFGDSPTAEEDFIKYAKKLWKEQLKN